MAERQKHGFDYEQHIINKHNLVRRISYSYKWDTYEKYNGINYPVSIKYVGLKSSIDFGDFKRQTKVDIDFILYVGFWSGKKTNLVQEYKILITKENWSKYFGNKTIIQEMLNEMKSISNKHSDDNKWSIFTKKYKRLYGNSIISLRFKRDHKKQKRVQCGITRTNFIKVIVKNNYIICQELKNTKMINFTQKHILLLDL